jgi:hypothetical protein
MAPSSKVPIYPRPVSPLSAESLYLEPKDIIYETSQSSSDDDVQARATKRRRIEELGEQYLRGDGLHILSAGLQGPFHSKWKNPWGKRGRATKRAVAEIPETTGRPVNKLQAQKSSCAKARNSKVEEWLRRSSAYSGLELGEQSSPTPVRTKIVAATEDVTYGPSCRLDSKFEMHKVVGHSGYREHNTKPVARPSKSVDCLHRLDADDAHIKRRAWVSHAANADRAEFAALKSKRRVVEVAPSSTMLSPFEYRRVSDGVQKRRKFEEVAEQLQEENESMAPPETTQQRNLHVTSGDEEPDESERLHATSDRADFLRAAITSTSSAIPALPTDTSRSSVANLPSAQPQSLDVPAPSTNNLAFEEQALAHQSNPPDVTEEPPQNTNGEGLKAAPFTRDLNGHGSKLTSEENQTPHLKDKVASGVDRTLFPETIAKVGLVPNTQDMLAGMSPLTFSTIKRAASGFERLTTPATATKRRLEKSSRTPSFAQGERFSSGSSQGSLKRRLRVSKGGSSLAIGKENRMISVGEAELNEQLADSVARPAKECVLPEASLKGLKSALKPSGPPLRTAPFPSSKGSTSTGIDGGQNIPVMGDDTFDLEGTMNDLGSYLETWDVEKEASCMGIDT